MKKRGPNSSVVCETLEPRRFLSVGDILPAGYATGTKPATITESSVQQGADTIVISGDSIERKTAGGSLDPTFGTNGSVSFPFTPTAVGLASSGQIIVAGNSGTDIYAARLNPDGQFDNSYNGGYATIPLTSGDNYSGTKFVINSSGDVTLIVQGENPTEIQESEDGGLFIVTARLNDAGQLDTTYGDAGFSGFTAMKPASLSLPMAPRSSPKTPLFWPGTRQRGNIHRQLWRYQQRRFT